MRSLKLLLFFSLLGGTLALPSHQYTAKSHPRTRTAKEPFELEFTPGHPPLAQKSLESSFDAIRARTHVPIHPVTNNPMHRRTGQSPRSHGRDWRVVT